MAQLEYWFLYLMYYYYTYLSYFILKQCFRLIDLSFSYSSPIDINSYKSKVHSSQLMSMGGDGVGLIFKRELGVWNSVRFIFIACID